MTGHLCAVCGRPVDGLEEACKSDGQWFCSPGHFLSYKGKPARRRRQAGIGAGVLGLVVLVGVVWAVRDATARHVAAGEPVPKQFTLQIDQKTTSANYSDGRGLADCLATHGVTGDRFAASQDERAKHFPPGVNAELWFLGPVTPGFSELRVYFFNTPAQARQGARQLAGLDIYGQGIANTALNRAMEKSIKDTGGSLKPPALPQADKLESVHGNAVAIWGYPHTNFGRSTRIFDSCLAATA